MSGQRGLPGSLVTAALLSLSGLFCAGPVDVSMGGGSEGDCRGIAGVVLDTDGTRGVTGAAVILRKADYLMAPGDPFINGDRMDGATTFTGDSGEFRIDSVPIGEYVVEVNDGAGSGLLYRCGIGEQDSLVALPTRSIGPMGMVRGIVTLREIYGDVYVMVRGMERLVPSNKLTAVFEVLLPRGSYELQVVLAGSDTDSAVYSEVEVQSGDTTYVGAVELLKECEDYACDSLVVRGLLDGNGLTSVAVEDVARVQSGRIRALDLSARGVSALPVDIGKLSALSTLELGGNQLSSLPPSVGNLEMLDTLDLSANNLTELPVAMTRLWRMKRLDVSGNQLSSLPPAFGGMWQIEWLDISANQLQSLPFGFGAHQGLRVLKAQTNALAELPESFSTLDSLDTLWLHANQLQALPADIVSIAGLEELRIGDNRLCTLDPAVEQWLTVLAPSWRDTQTCP